MTFQGPTVKTCRAKFRIQVSWIPSKPRGLGLLVEDTPSCLSMLLEKAQTDLRVRGGVWE